MVFHIDIKKACRRKYLANGEEVEPDFGSKQKVNTGYLMSSYSEWQILSRLFPFTCLLSSVLSCVLSYLGLSYLLFYHMSLVPVFCLCLLYHLLSLSPFHLSPCCQALSVVKIIFTIYFSLC